MKLILMTALFLISASTASALFINGDGSYEDLCGSAAIAANGGTIPFICTNGMGSAGGSTGSGNNTGSNGAAPCFPSMPTRKTTNGATADTVLGTVFTPANGCSSGIFNTQGQCIPIWLFDGAATPQKQNTEAQSTGNYALSRKDITPPNKATGELGNAATRGFSSLVAPSQRDLDTLTKANELKCKKYEIACTCKEGEAYFPSNNPWWKLFGKKGGSCIKVYF